MEKIPVKIYEDSGKACCCVARRIGDLIRERQKEGKPAVLGLATGSTPIDVYKELIRQHRQEGLDLSGVITFNLDEYWPMDSRQIQSYHAWMYRHFFDHVNIKAEHIHIPSGSVPRDQVGAMCADYEQAIQQAGGLDIQILGIGRTGHIGFNEPGSLPESRTRLIQLDRVTRKDAASDFFGEENVPQMAITMGIGTIQQAREIILLAFGEHKAFIVQKTVEGTVSPEIAASYLQNHSNVTFYLDYPASEKLSRIATLWKADSCQWDDVFEKKAVLWLSQKLQKPILKLTSEDYNDNHLAELQRERGRAYDINLRVFHHMMRTITGWPGGKSSPKRILIFSPHPDDDVICMGGTICHLARQKHDVHIAYMVSGFLSVFDHNVIRHAEFVKAFNQIFGLTPDQTRSIEEHIESFLVQKQPGELDSKEVRQIKTMIRQTEAIAAAKYCGVTETNLHFLNLPFYDESIIHKVSFSDADIAVTTDLLERLRPEMIFAAGDLSDPHGTHRLCFTILMEACRRVFDSEAMPAILLYRGAWQEWAPEQIDMAVPLSPDELRQKRFSIFRHESQKDKAMFPGPYDEREFWQRAEERNMNTAKLYDQFGLPEYHAIEAFARFPIQMPAAIKALFDLP